MKEKEIKQLTAIWTRAFKKCLSALPYAEKK